MQKFKRWETKTKKEGQKMVLNTVLVTALCHGKRRHN